MLLEYLQSTFPRPFHIFNVCCFVCLTYTIVHKHQIKCLVYAELLQGFLSFLRQCQTTAYYIYEAWWNLYNSVNSEK